MKPPIALHSSSFSRAAARKTSPRTRPASRAPQRECIALSDATDCLLEAYDVVAARAYENFLARGPGPDGELQDWFRAERDLLLDFPIHVEESESFVYALASIPGVRAARLAVGIESRWLVILAQHAPDGRCQAVSDESRGTASRSTRNSGPEPRSQAARREPPSDENGEPLSQAKASRQVDSSGESHRRDSHATGSRGAVSHPQVGRSAEQHSEYDRPAKSICILELPANVDAARAIAVLADGILGIRMPKSVMVS